MKTSLLIKSIVAVAAVSASLSSMNPAFAKGGRPDHAGGPKDKDTTEETQPTQTTSTTDTSPVNEVMCSVDNVLLGTTAATACRGPFSGNDTGAQATLIDELNAGTMFNLGEGVTWELAGKSDGGTNNYGFRADNGTDDGTWGFANNEFTSGLKTFVVSLKSSTSYSTYLFENVDLSVTGLTGAFNTIGVALNGSGRAGKALSHASLFVASVPPSGTVVEPKPEQRKIPEPATAAALGFVAIGSLKLKRKIAHT